MGMKADGEHAPSLPSAVSGLCACFRAISVRYVSFSEGTPKRKEELKRLLQNSENRLPKGRGSQNSRSFDSLSELRALAVVLKLPG